MKTTVNNYIYSTFNERGMKSFEKKVEKLLRDNCLSGFFICLNAWKERASGYGHYYDIIEIQIENATLKIKRLTTNSIAWDNWNEPTGKDKRELFLAVLEDEIEQLKDFVLEQEEE